MWRCMVVRQVMVSDSVVYVGDELAGGCVVVGLTRSVDSRPPRCEAPLLKLGAVSQLVSPPSHGTKVATLEGCTMSPTKVRFCQVRVRAARLMSALPISVSMSTMTPGGGEGGGGEGGGGEGGGAGGGEGGGGEGDGGSPGGGGEGGGGSGGGGNRGGGSGGG